MTGFRTTLCVCAVVAATARPGGAWEAATTHAGLTEQAALASVLHERLRVQFGYERGLFHMLTVPRPDAQELFSVLGRLNPTHGYVPDGRGRLHALGWLVAGSVVADSPADLAANHFFDPATGSGLNDSSLAGIGRSVAIRLTTLFYRESLERRGVPAPAWIEDPKNPMGLAGFNAQYVKAVSAKTPGERMRHLAGALLAAGAMLHVLEDVGSPSHARNDLAAHLDRLGPGEDDVGSRFERVAALGFGRLGVPAPTTPVEDRPLAGFFTARDGSGLADRTAAAWFSTSTLPRSINLGGDPQTAVRDRLRGALRRPTPAPPATLDLGRAAEEGGARLANQDGVCLARYRVADQRLAWFVDDACALEQVRAILPQVGGYAAGMLDTLFRGSLSLENDGAQVAVRAGAVAFGAGRLTTFWDDGRGVRTKLSEVAVQRTAAGQVLAPFSGVPEGARRVTALFEGVDANGRPLLATGTSSYPIAPR